MDRHGHELFSQSPAATVSDPDLRDAALVCVGAARAGATPGSSTSAHCENKRVSWCQREWVVFYVYARTCPRARSIARTNSAGLCAVVWRIARASSRAQSTNEGHWHSANTHHFCSRAQTDKGSYACPLTSFAFADNLWLTVVVWWVRSRGWHQCDVFCAWSSAPCWSWSFKRFDTGTVSGRRLLSSR